MTNFEIINPYERPREVATDRPPRPLPLPGPGVDFDVRLAIEDDIPWIDALQRASNREARALGFWSRKMFEGYIAKKNIWIAESVCPNSGTGFQPVDRGAMGSADRPTTGWKPVPLGYCIASDTYFKREDVGVIYQMNIAPGSRRSFVASNLLQRVWETWPWGVKLCGLWCAQDLKANHFWEKCGFRPIAFRAGSSRHTVTNLDGSTSEGRVHLYWQKRIRAGDTETSYWYPSKTGGGAMREDRVVFPMPPASEVHWSKAAPRFLPGVGEVFEAIREDRSDAEREALKLLAPPPEAGRAEREARLEAKAAARRKREAAAQTRQRRAATMAEGGLSFAPPPPSPEQVDVELAADRSSEADARKDAKRKAQQQAKLAGDAAAKRNHPVLEQMARTLRDRWVEAVSSSSGGAMEPRLLGGGSCGDVPDYDVSRQIEDPSGSRSQDEERKQVTNVKRVAA
ncbi:MAG: hypothetical protein AAGH92_01125 [Planctomycetota bacterium]